MSTSPSDDTGYEQDRERRRLFGLPDFPRKRPAEETGVLLSDRIRHYSTTYQLIAPFDPRHLKPAGYDLTVGGNYSLLGQRYALNEGKSLFIEPYQVAIVETRETLNLPEFLIGRWNIRVQLAYQGLLWVGGAQVDPGFRGNLCCPIYNLSTKRVPLEFGQPLAMIDFVTTTPFTEGACKTFDYRGRRKLIFVDYDLLDSGIEAEVKAFAKKIDDASAHTTAKLQHAASESQTSFGEIRMRIDNFVTLTFTVVAVLFAALGIIATKPAEAPAFLNSPVWVATVALFFALRAYLGTSGQQTPQNVSWSTWLRSGAFALLVTIIVTGASALLISYSAHLEVSEIRQARQQAVQAAADLAQERRAREAAIQQLQKQSDAKIDDLQRQIKQPAARKGQ